MWFDILHSNYQHKRFCNYHRNYLHIVYSNRLHIAYHSLHDNWHYSLLYNYSTSIQQRNNSRCYLLQLFLIMALLFLPCF